VTDTDAELVQLLQATAAFGGFSSEQLFELVRLLHPVAFEAGRTIVVEGEPADRWYVIADGSAAVTHSNLIGQPVTLAVLGPGDSFGERALIRDDQPRSATIGALTDLKGFALDRSEFQRSAPIAPAFAEHIAARLDALAIDTALKRASPFASLPQPALWSLVHALEPRTVRAGELIIRQGDAGECMYLIRSGSVEVTKRKRRLAVLRPGDAFGELALLTTEPRSATVRALEDSQLLALGRDDFQAVARDNVAVAAYFRELIGARFRGAPNQHLLLPDPLATIMPLVSIRRRRRYWLVLLAGMLLFVLLTFAAQSRGNPSAAVYAVMVVGALIGPVVFVQYLAESNILAERPLELLVTAALGAALGLPPALWLQRESGILPGSLLTALLIAAIEEPAKLLGVVWLLHRPSLRFRMDGVIFGAAAGMGFAALETILYAFARVESVGVLIGVLWFRALLSPFTHGTWTSIVCATVWRERDVGFRNGAWRIGAALTAAVLLHGLWDWPGFPMPLNFVWLVVVGVSSVLVLRAILHHAALEEQRAVVALAPEVASATTTMEGVRCVGCGQRTPAGARYCPRCGLALRQMGRAS
jgi:protease PrsW